VVLTARLLSTITRIPSIFAIPVRVAMWLDRAFSTTEAGLIALGGTDRLDGARCCGNGSAATLHPSLHV
jgi:hypothetical protein